MVKSGQKRKHHQHTIERPVHCRSLSSAKHTQEVDDIQVLGEKRRQLFIEVSSFLSTYQYKLASVCFDPSGLMFPRTEAATSMGPFRAYVRRKLLENQKQPF